MVRRKDGAMSKLIVSSRVPVAETPRAISAIALRTLPLILAWCAGTLGPGMASGQSKPPDGDPFVPVDGAARPAAKPPDSIDLTNGQELDDLQLLPPGRPKLESAPEFREWTADRKLTEKQASRVGKLIAVAADVRGPPWLRGTAIIELGKWGHATAIPVLIDVLKKSHPAHNLRRDCVFALARIPDKRVVEPLIEAVRDVYSGDSADSALRSITHANWGGWNTPDAPGRDPVPNPVTDRAGYEGWLLRRHHRWHEWWDEHKGEVTLDRSGTFGMSGPPY
jgi:hypothetical protein